MPSPSADAKPIAFQADYYLKQYNLESRLVETLSAAGYASIEDVRNHFVVFDLSRTYWCDLGTLLWLISLLHKLKRQGNDLQLVFPEPVSESGANLWDFLIRWRFFKALSVCVDDPVNLLRPNQAPHINRDIKYHTARGTDEYGAETTFHTARLLEITTLSDCASKKLAQLEHLEAFLTKYSDKIVITALSSFCGWDRDLTKRFVQEVIGEGLRNSFLHSAGTFANVSMRLDSKNLILAISDNGEGIPNVLRQFLEEREGKDDLLSRSDVDLIKYFTEPDLIIDSQLIELSVQKGTSSLPMRKGLGLYYLKSAVLSKAGQLRIRSGTACVDFTPEKVKASDEMLPSPGTMLRIVTPRTG